MPAESQELAGLWSAIGAVFVLSLILAWLAWRLPPFIRKIRNINMELRRCDPREREQWRAQRRHLWYALINPFLPM